MMQFDIHCDKDGIRIKGTNDIGSTSDSVVTSKQQFLRLCEHWWNTYCEGYKQNENTADGNDTQGFWALMSDDGYIGLTVIMEIPVTYDSPDPVLVATFNTKEDAEAYAKTYPTIEAKPIFVKPNNINNERN